MQEYDERARKIIEELNKRKGLSFEEKLEEVYTYLLKHNELPAKSSKKIKFSDNTIIGSWLIKNRKQLEEMQEYDGRARAIIEELNKRKNLSFEEKLEEVYNYLLKHKELPSTKDTTIKFSDGAKMGVWLIKNKIKIINNYNSNENAKRLVDLILQIKPNYFDSILRTLKAKKEFETVSKFEEVKQRIIESKMKGKQDERRKI